MSESDSANLPKDIPSEKIGSKNKPFIRESGTAGQFAIDALDISIQEEANAYFLFRDVKFFITEKGVIDFADDKDRDDDYNKKALEIVREDFMEILINTSRRYNNKK